MSGAVQISDERSRMVGWQVVPGGRPADPLDLLRGRGMPITLPRDRELHAQGDAAAFCYRVISGCVRTVKLMEDGRRQVGAFLFAGDCFGFDVLDTHDFAAEAVTDVVVRCYRRREVETLTECHPALARRLREMSAQDLREAYGRMLMLGRKTAAERVASFLLEMSARQDGARTAAVPMSRIDIADHLGLTVETVCRMMTHLRREGTIAIGQGSIELRSLGALRQMAADARH